LEVTEAAVAVVASAVAEY